MSTYKHIDRICAVILILCLVLTVLFMNGEALGLQISSRQYGYESRLFDTSKVHTLAIVIEDWDSFLDTCESEEYSVCSVVIDGDSIKNVAIRGKGNTSLSNVSSMNSQRYSFKIEFDHYDSGKNYYGLDKLSLNNIIQDNTYMKDYLTYRMMDAFGVDSPLCSYVYITVNGEDWGLYLAVEGVEDAFLRRNYGNADGELYKPDSLSFGGGRGNGKDFDMEDFMGNTEDADTEDTASAETGGEAGTESGGFGSFGGGMSPGGFGDFDGEMPEGMESPTDMELPEGMELPTDMELPEGMELPTDMELPEGMEMPGNIGGGMGSSDVKLSYIDDDPSSYSNIFDNAKTDITTADQNRLIASLKTLSSYENIESVVDTEEVLRYFVVHNFVVNGDSYTGSMIHNYYLYEEDGVMRMIPWDYNLAYGTFSGGAASSAVNDAIDDVLDDRPMQAWIFSDESYISRYHALYAEFLETVDIQAIIEEADALIAEYVERDPTKFCTTEEYEAGVEALKSFCALRSESVSGQLDGSIPSTSTLQQEDSTSLVNADGLTLSDMGTMSNGGGGGGGMGGDRSGSFNPFSRDSGDSESLSTGETDGTESRTPPEGFEDSGSGEGNAPPDGFGGESGEMPTGGFDGEAGEMPTDGFGGESGNMPSGGFGGRNDRQGGMTPPGGNSETETAQSDSTTEDGETETESRKSMGGGTVPDFPGGGEAASGGSAGSTLILLGGSVLLLLLGLLLAWRYRK